MAINTYLDNLIDIRDSFVDSLQSIGYSILDSVTLKDIKTPINTLIRNGEISGGIVPNLTYLPNSNPNNVIESQDITTFDGWNNWGKFNIYTNNLSVTTPPTVIDDYIHFSTSYGVCCHLDSQNTDVTAYVVLKLFATASGNTGIIQIPYSLNSNNDPNFYAGNNSYNIYTSIYGTDTKLSIIGNDWHVYCISIDSTNKIVKFYLNGVYLHQKTFSNSGGVVFFTNSSYSNGSSCNADVKYCGVVAALEDDTTIINNLQTIMSLLIS